MSAPRITAVVFDLGGVLIDWDPHYLYRQLMPEHDVAPFLDEIGFRDWNHAQDAGGTSWDDAVDALAARYPHRRDLIAAYPQRFAETMSGPVPGSVAVLEDLHRRGVRLLALTNWSQETFPRARATFAFLDRFEGIVVSGTEGVAKPDPRLFRTVLERYDLVPGETVFIDDAPANVEAARALGLVALRFTDADQLRDDLSLLGLLADGGSG